MNQLGASGWGVALVIAVGLAGIPVPSTPVAAAQAPPDAYGVVENAAGGQLTLTSEARDLVTDYSDAIRQEWLIEAGSSAPSAAAADEKSFGKKLLGRFLPLAGRVVAPVAGAISIYEVCSSLIEEGCWLFRRDDTDLGVSDGVVTYTWHWHASVNSAGFPNGEETSFSFPALAGKTDVLMAQKSGNHAPVIHMGDVPVPPGGYSNCGVSWPGPSGGVAVLTAELSPCYVYASDGTRSQISVPRRKWWSPADDLDELIPQPDSALIPNSTATVPASSNWPDELADVLSAPASDRLRQALGHIIDPAMVSNPYDTDRDRRCELSLPEGDPAPERGSVRDDPRHWDSFYSGFIDNDGDAVSLRWGRAFPSAADWGGWGYRHIAAKHGWTGADRVATAEALARPPTPSGSAGTRVFEGPTYELNGQLCYRRVVVSDAPGPDGLPPRGIVTSYGRPR